MSTDIGQMLIIFMLVVVPIWLIQVAVHRNQQKNKIEELKKNYDLSLNNDDRLKVFEIGREYYSIYKKQNGLTFDEEQAIVNDLKNVGKE